MNPTATATIDAGAAEPTRTGFVATWTLTLLVLTNVFNYADRALLGIVVEPIRKELLLSDTQISIISGFAFSVFFLLAGIAIARWVDRGNRKLILVLGVIVWSLATAATGWAQGFYSLSLCRVFVGVGEAVVFPVALSLLADLYPGPKLSRSVSIFQASAGIGIMAGSILAGVLAAKFGWRTMFEIFGAAGALLLLLIAFTMRVAPRVAGVVQSANEGIVKAIKKIVAVPGMGWLALGYGVSNMMLACLPVWAPTFLFRSHNVELAKMGALVGPPAVIGGIVGGVLSGILASRLIQRSGNRWAGLMVPIIALPFAAPAFALFLFAPTIPVVLVGIAAMNFLLASALGPCVALAVSLVQPNQRGVTSTLMLISQNLLAFAIGPLLVGVVSDLIAPSFGLESLRYALSMMLVAPVLASLMRWFAHRQLHQA